MDMVTEKTILQLLLKTTATNHTCFFQICPNRHEKRNGSQQEGY